jgi:uncharacterized protein
MTRQLKQQCVTGIAGLALAASVPSVAAEPIELTAPGPLGPLAGTLIDTGGADPMLLILPGSGPTDRDGNNSLGITAASYKMLADALATRHISTLRADKRGQFGSKAAVADANAVTINDYAKDAKSWIDVVRSRAPRKCVWLLGHSEGGLIALQAARGNKRVCGVILLATPGRRLGDVFREQFRSNPANAPIMHDALRTIDGLEAGQRVDVSAMHPALQRFFGSAVQGFLIDLFAKDPAEMAAKIRVPTLVVQGERDIQVTVADARALVRKRPDAELFLIPAMTHVLKDAETRDRASIMATYSNPSLPVSALLVEAITSFICGPKQTIK